MTSKELHEQITTYVAERVDEAEYRRKTAQSIQPAPASRDSYELELATKTVVRGDAAHQAGAPDAVQGGIATDAESPRDSRPAAAVLPRVPWMDRFADYFLSPMGIGVAVLLIVVGGYVFLQRDKSPADAILSDLPSTVETTSSKMPKGPINLFNMASLNFESILDKQYPLQLKTADRDELKKWFTDNGVSYEVAFPIRATLVGGSVSGSGKEAVAHQIYSAGESILYCVQTPRAALMGGKQAYLTEDMLKRIDGGEKVWEEPGLHESLLLFRRNDLVYAVIANVERDRLEKLVVPQ